MRIDRHDLCKKRMMQMTQDERSSLAKKAAEVRWLNDLKIPKATHTGELIIGDIVIPCAVLDNNKRVVTEHGICNALGSRSGSGKAKARLNKKNGVRDELPQFLSPNSLKPFVLNNLESGPLSKIIYKHGKRHVVAYDAGIIPFVCDIWLQARDAGVLMESQYPKAKRAEILIRGLAKIGIVALIDEATGFQEDRDRSDLHKLLSVYLAEERLEWAKQFPDEFYKQIYRLKGWLYPGNQNRTPLVGKITNDIVYKKLPEGVIEELQTLNPVMKSTQRRIHKHHQFLSIDIGQKDLREHLLQLIALMRVSQDWNSFEENMKVGLTN